MLQGSASPHKSKTVTVCLAELFGKHVNALIMHCQLNGSQDPVHGLTSLNSFRMGPSQVKSFLESSRRP